MKQVLPLLGYILPEFDSIVKYITEFDRQLMVLLECNVTNVTNVTNVLHLKSLIPFWVFSCGAGGHGVGGNDSPLDIQNAGTL